MLYPSVFRGMKAWTIFGAAGSLVSMPWRPRNVHIGLRLPKCLWPVKRYPPLTRSALVVDRSTGMSFPFSA